MTFDEKYGAAVHYVTHRLIPKTFRDEYTYEELHALVLEVAAERYQEWDSGKYDPIYDLRLHARKALEQDRYARGWHKEGPRGNQHWVGPPVPGFDERAVKSIAGWSLWAEEPRNRATFSLMPMAGWPPFTWQQRREFARIMRRRYPLAVKAFLALDKDKTLPESERRIRRIRLQGVYAGELDAAMQAVARKHGLSLGGRKTRKAA